MCLGYPISTTALKMGITQSLSRGKEEKIFASVTYKKTNE